MAAAFLRQCIGILTPSLEERIASYKKETLFLKLLRHWGKGAFPYICRF